MSPPDPVVFPDSGAASEAVFPTPYAARAFALAVALNERGVFSWSEWAETLGAMLSAETGTDPEAYWRAWISALEEVLGRHDIASRRELLEIQSAWRSAAEATPHGEVIELSRRPAPRSSSS